MRAYYDAVACLALPETRKHYAKDSPTGPDRFYARFRQRLRVSRQYFSGQPGQTRGPRSGRGWHDAQPGSISCSARRWSTIRSTRLAGTTSISSVSGRNPATFKRWVTIVFENDIVTVDQRGSGTRPQPLSPGQFSPRCARIALKRSVNLDTVPVLNRILPFHQPPPDPDGHSRNIRIAEISQQAGRGNSIGDAGTGPQSDRDEFLTRRQREYDLGIDYLRHHHDPDRR